MEILETQDSEILPVFLSTEFFLSFMSLRIATASVGIQSLSSLGLVLIDELLGLGMLPKALEPA